jgi:alcohol dehydrogenase
MKAIYFEEHGEPEVLRYGDFPDPEVPAGWVKLRLRAASLNYADIFSRRGMPGIKSHLPMIPGNDGAGEIAELGEGVEGWRVGQRVQPKPGYVDMSQGILDILGETRPGTFAEYVAVRASQLVAVPDNVADEVAACLPAAYGSAYRMLFSRGQLQADEKILILGASGGVGTACVLLAKLTGAYVIAAAGSAEKCERLRAIGADETIDYSAVEFDRYVRETTGTLFRGGGCDVVVNFTGGDTWAKSLRCVRRGGRLLTCGATAAYDPKTDLRYIYQGEMTIIGSTSYTMEDQIALLDLVAEGKLRPVIDRIMPLSQGIEALRLLESRQVFGKIILKPDL